MDSKLPPLWVCSVIRPKLHSYWRKELATPFRVGQGQGATKLHPRSCRLSAKSTPFRPTSAIPKKKVRPLGLKHDSAWVESVVVNYLPWKGPWNTSNHGWHLFVIKVCFFVVFAGPQTPTWKDSNNPWLEHLQMKLTKDYMVQQAVTGLPPRWISNPPEPKKKVSRYQYCGILWI